AWRRLRFGAQRPTGKGDVKLVSGIQPSRPDGVTVTVAVDVGNYFRSRDTFLDFLTESAGCVLIADAQPARAVKTDIDAAVGVEVVQKQLPGYAAEIERRVACELAGCILHEHVQPVRGPDRSCGDDEVVAPVA